MKFWLAYAFHSKHLKKMYAKKQWWHLKAVEVWLGNFVPQHKLSSSTLQVLRKYCLMIPCRF